MKIPVWTELVCRTCASASEGRFSFNRKVDVKALQEVAASRGWLFKYDECFCSRLCLKKYEDEEGQK